MTCSRPQRTATGGLEPGTSRPKVLGFTTAPSAYITYNGENGVSTFSRLFLIGSFFILAGNDDISENLDKFEIWPDSNTDYGVSCT